MTTSVHSKETRPHTPEASIQFQSSPHRICGGKIGTEARFTPSVRPCLLSITSPMLHTHSFTHHRRDIISPVGGIIKQWSTKQEQRNVHTWLTTYFFFFFANLRRNVTPLDHHHHHRALQMILGCLSCYYESFPLFTLPRRKISHLSSYAFTQLWHNDIKSSAFFSVISRKDVQAAGLHLPTKLHGIIFQ